MTRARNLILAAALLMLGVIALEASDASASAFDAFRHRQHGPGLQDGADPVRLAGPGRPSCLLKQVKSDGTVVFIDRCAPESAASRPAIAQAR